jgi:hypothetical protein
MLVRVRIASLLAVLILAGCVERRLLVRTDPPDAEVTVNGERIGRSPVTWRFSHYGKVLIEVEKHGYEPSRALCELHSPWYQKPGIDFFADVLVPARIRDDHEVNLVLEATHPLTESEKERGVAEMSRAADKWRKEAEASR